MTFVSGSVGGCRGPAGAWSRIYQISIAVYSAFISNQVQREERRGRTRLSASVFLRVRFMVGRVVSVILGSVSETRYTLDLPLNRTLVPKQTFVHDQMWVISSEVTWGNAVTKRLHPADAKQTQIHRQARKDIWREASNERSILGTICYLLLFLQAAHTLLPYSQHCTF